jgi:hypothetical protein
MAVPPIKVPSRTEPELQQQDQQHQQPVQQDLREEHDDNPNKQDQSVSPSHSVSVSENSDTVLNTVETGNTADMKEVPSESSAPSPEETTSVEEGTLPQDDATEPETKKMKLDEDCGENTDTNDTKPQEEQSVEQEAVMEEKQQTQRRKRSSNSDQEHHDDEASSGTAATTVPTTTTTTTTTAVSDVASDASPSSGETNANEEVPLPSAHPHDDAASDEMIMKETCTASEEAGEAPALQEEEALVGDNGCAEDSNAADGVVDSVVVEERGVDEGVGSAARDGEDDDKEDDFTLRMSSSEEEEGGDEDTRLATKAVTKQEEINEDKQVKEVEERKKLKGKKDGRKKSKHKSKHHHQESSARKRKAHRSESTPTILQYQEDVMKLKVKLGSIKPMMSHRHHHHHHHSKHNRKSQLELDSPNTNVGLRSNGESSSGLNTTTSAKERLLQMRAVRHKNITTTKSTTTPATGSTPVKDDANNRTKKTEILMPPSSITVSKVNIADKRKFETQKASNSSNSGEESKRPSLEIMLVNAPTTAAVSTTCMTTATTTITASNTTEACATVKQSSNDSAVRTPDHGSYKSSRPPPPTIPLVRIRKSTVTSIRPPSGLTITPKIPTTTSLSTKTTTTISKTPIPNTAAAVTETGDKSKEETNREQCIVIEDEQAMRHDDIGALDLSGKSSRCKAASSAASSPTVASGFPSAPSPVLKTSGGTTSTHQSILSIAQSLVHRQLQQQQQHGLININSSSPGKVSKSPGTDNPGTSAHPAAVTAPVYAMSNLKTLSDTAVRIRNEMAAQSDKGIRSGGAVKPQLQQKPAALSVQITSASEAGSPSSVIGRTSVAVTYTSNSNPRSGLSQPPTRSPTGHQQYQALPNNSIPPLRIPIPPTALSKASPLSASSRAGNVPRLHELYPSTQGAMGRGRSIISGLQNRSGINNHTKPGPNQAVRHIPNPSALLFRQQQTHNRLQQQNSSAVQNRHSAVSKALFTNQSSFNNTTVKASASTSAAPPVSSIRKMENMTRNIEKVAQGLTVRAVEAHSK